MIGIMLSNNPLLPAFMGDFSIATMSTEAVDSLEAKVSGGLVQPKHGPPPTTRHHLEFACQQTGSVSRSP
jgi:hypothetical protein